MKDILTEDVPTNNVGGGAIDGIGTGPNPEPGVNIKKKREIMSFKEMLRRRKEKND